MTNTITMQRPIIADDNGVRGTSPKGYGLS